jgi:ATP-dependent Clp protease ATP-binding subunit ClpX
LIRLLRQRPADAAYRLECLARGARGLRSIMESILLDTVFDLPSLEGVKEVVVSKQLVDGTAPPLYIYADSSDQTSGASA